MMKKEKSESRGVVAQRITDAPASEHGFVLSGGMAEAKKLRVYCETSFWSYLNGHPTPLAHIAVKQAATLRWWQEIAPNCEIYVSPFVDDEAEGGDPESAALRRKSTEGFQTLNPGPSAVSDVAVALIDGHALPKNETTDASHIAIASVYGMDVLLTWNCRHMANPVTLPKTSAIVAKAGFACPVVITPAEFLERREEFGL